MSFPRYPEYKDSGVEWLGQVPAHWDIWPFKRVISGIESGTSVNSVDVPAASDEYGVLKTSCVYSGHFDPSENKRVVQEEIERLSCPVRPHRLIVSRMNTPQLVGAAGIVEADAKNLFLPDRLWQVTLGDVHQKFAFWWTQSTMYRDQVQAAATGTSASMKNIAQDQFMSLWIPVPSSAEQDAIVDLLDRETAKIDTLVAEQERLIALLKEKRQAVISHAVTKGLNPNAPMKDSGVESIGPVPAHWNVTRLKYAAIPNSGIQMGPFGGMLVDLSHVHTGYKVFGQENTITGDFTAGSRWISEARFAELESYRVRVGDLLLTRKGSLGNARLVHDLPSVGIIDSDTIRIRADHQRVVPNFLAMLLHESAYMSSQIDQSKRGAILSGLNTSTIANLYIALPPVAEQEEMLDSLESTTAMIDEARETCSRMVDLLSEHRSALITAAVTGQIDVRGSIVSEAA